MRNPVYRARLEAFSESFLLNLELIKLSVRSALKPGGFRSRNVARIRWLLVPADAFQLLARREIGRAGVSKAGAKQIARKDVTVLMDSRKRRDEIAREPRRRGTARDATFRSRPRQLVLQNIIYIAQCSHRESVK